jgi:hypothetical protein
MQNHQNNGHQNKKRGPDNTVAVAEIFQIQKV